MEQPPRPPAAGDAAEPRAPGPVLRADVVQELISHVPAWPVRVGNTVILGGLLVLLLVCWIVEYPEPVEARATLTTEQLPLRVTAAASGSVTRLFVREKQRVTRGAHLMLLENPARYEDVLRLLRWLEAAEPALRARDGVPVDPPPEGLALGQVQRAYAALQQHLSAYDAFVRDPYYDEKAHTLDRQRAAHEQLSRTLEAQSALGEEELALAAARFNRDRQLLARKVIAQHQFEETQTRWLAQQQASKQAERALADNQIRQAELRGALVELQQQRRDQERTLRLALLEALEHLENELTLWRQTYVVEAPVSGRVSFFRPLQENQFVAAQEPLLALVPESDTLFARLLLPQSGAGKVRAGQRVRLALDSYPTAEFGTVEGTVEDISLVARDRAYLIRVALPQGLVTRYGARLAFRQEMEGTATILTDEVRLLEVIWNTSRGAVGN